MSLQPPSRPIQKHDQKNNDNVLPSRITHSSDDYELNDQDSVEVLHEESIVQAMVIDKDKILVKTTT
ncbi:9186_t:CDS:2 [Racocetra fulgida]|uniref:9186_t:CDS:1 n=1 Tax=Racocetra fulgida TaxID=60492 RepID=A0A9N8ZZJ5_9GLOM|nr:9186_t:CDS:2 [Racocetra fulgida]